MRLGEIGIRIKAERQANGMTQAGLAALAGVSRATLIGLERGTIHELGAEKLEAILQLLGYELAPKPSPRHAILLRMARRYIWWQPPVESVKTPDRVLAQVMDVGTHEDIRTVSGAFGESALADVLAHARPGWFRPKSWAFWHVVLGLSDAGRIPALPARRGDVLPDPA